MMKRHLIFNSLFTLCLSLLFVAQNSWGENLETNKHVSQTFTVEKMTCAACPITVRKAMSSIEGVQSIEVNFGAKMATATFDPALVDAASIAQASTDVGFPAYIQSEAP